MVQTEQKDPVVIVGAKRTPIGVFQGMLSTVRAPQLAAAAIQGALAQGGVDAQEVEELFMGCVLNAGMGQAPARQVVFSAGLPNTVSASLLNKVCGSGMQSIMLACDALKLGRLDVAVGGGMENMSQAPYLLERARSGYRLGHQKVTDHIFVDGLEDSMGTGGLMGMFAEETALAYGMSREEQDAFAILSAERVLSSVQNCKFRGEIAPISGGCQEDETPSRIRLEKVSQLKPAFKAGGTVTAANSSSLADGAAALVLTRLSTAEKRGYTPLAKVKGYVTYSGDPAWFTTAPVGAIQKLMALTGWELSDIDLFEINEAFAIVTLATMRDLNLSQDCVNVHGGAVALGHPIGATGARILVTLLYALESHGLKRGIASLCVGGGEAVAMAIERLT